LYPRPAWPAFAARAVWVGLALSVLGGCASLPSSGPDVNQVIQASREPFPAFQIVDFTTTRDSEGVEPRPVNTASFKTIARSANPTAGDRVVIGRTLQVRVFEVGAALFSGAPTGTYAPCGASSGGEAPTANAETLPSARVSPDGSIAVPYVGKVEAAGRTPTEIAGAIEASLRGKSQRPQVVVTVQQEQGNTIVMIGDVKDPDRRLLSYRREQLLDMIAMAVRGGDQSQARHHRLHHP
jgi:polysaccharide export outer membrane protein